MLAEIGAFNHNRNEQTLGMSTNIEPPPHLPFVYHTIALASDIRRIKGREAVCRVGGEGGGWGWVSALTK